MATRASSLLRQVVSQTNEKHSACLLFLHGSGDSAEGIRGWIKCLLKSDLKFPHIKIVYPSAPLRPYTPNMGQLSNVWFDRIGISPDVPEHLPTINPMCKEIGAIIEDEVTNGIPKKRIIIGGFSMGGCMALHCAYRFHAELAGVFALSSFLNNGSIIYQSLKENPKQLSPLFMAHGREDELIHHSWSYESYKQLQKSGITGQFHSLPDTSHELSKSELDLFKLWVSELLPETYE